MILAESSDADGVGDNQDLSDDLVTTKLTYQNIELKSGIKEQLTKIKN